MFAPWKKSYDKPDNILKGRDITFPTKDCIVRLYSQTYGFSSSHVQMWELDHKESWEPNNWCLWTMVLEKTLESPLDNKEIKSVNPKGNQPWILIRRTDAKAEAPVLCLPDAKIQLIGKDSDALKEQLKPREEDSNRGRDG